MDIVWLYVCGMCVCGIVYVVYVCMWQGSVVWDVCVCVCVGGYACPCAYMQRPKQEFGQPLPLSALVPQDRVFYKLKAPFGACTRLRTAKPSLSHEHRDSNPLPMLPQKYSCSLNYLPALRQLLKTRSPGVVVPLIPQVLGRLRQEDLKFQASFAYIVWQKKKR